MLFHAISEKDLRTAEMRGLPVAMIILVIVFGALVAVDLPIALTLGSITIAVGLAALIGRVFELSYYVVYMITMTGLAVAVLLDATIVRSVLVPASMALLGKRNGYLPRWLLWLPDLRVEGAALPTPAAIDATSAD